VDRKRATAAGTGGALEQGEADGLSSLVPKLGSVIGYKLRLAQLSVFQDFLRAFARFELRPAEFSVLALIAEQPGQKQTEIADKLSIKRANFVALMDGLERRGLAQRRRAAADRRSHSLHLTPEGVRFLHKIMGVWQTHEDHLVERLGGAKEKRRLIELLDRILDHRPDR
jgi:DNA-binding MarR family transcriptional regulator